MDYVSDRRGQLEMMLESNDNEQFQKYKILCEEHQIFYDEVNSRQDEFDVVERIIKRHFPTTTVDDSIHDIGSRHTPSKRQNTSSRLRERQSRR